jgi:hypothetical protein
MGCAREHDDAHNKQIREARRSRHILICQLPESDSNTQSPFRFADWEADGSVLTSDKENSKRFLPTMAGAK